MTEDKIIIGSRESALAVVQAEIVRRFILEHAPGINVEILKLKTTGDKILDRKLDEIGGKGLFVKELDQALIGKRSDISVHSLKDMPMDTPPELPVICYSKREDPRDVLVLPKGADKIDMSKPIGTSSPRRIIQLKKIFPDAAFESVRGNLQTRIRKLDEGQYSAIILAAAGMKRMGLEGRISRYFSVDELIPSAGQGILAVQGREGEEFPYLAGFEDKDSAYAAVCERSFVRKLNGGCSSPIAAHAEVRGKEICLRGLYVDDETGKSGTGKMTEIVKNIEECEALGRKLAIKLRREVSGR